MDSNINYVKTDKSNFEIKEESIQQIVISKLENQDVPIVEEKEYDYEDPKWIEKSNSIKARDNYTCQCCHAFNPMQGGLMFIQQGEYETYHQYNPPSNYMIHVKDYDFTINIDFYAAYHLTMPRLNVHHKIYYKNRKLWDYKDEELVTLCEDCHHYIHSLTDYRIPIVEETSNNKLILVGELKPKPYIHKLDHTDLYSFRPLSIVKENHWGLDLKGNDLIAFQQAKNENKKWYDYQNILDQHVARITHFKCYDPRWNKNSPEEIRKVADFVIKDFIENIMCYRKKE